MIDLIYLLAMSAATGNNVEPVAPGLSAAILAANNSSVVAGLLKTSTKPPSTRPNPIPINNPGSWVDQDDYPAQALRAEVEGTTGFSLTIGPDGRVSDCRITASSGSQDLDQATCVNVTRRALFHAALDGNGHPITGRYQNRVRWQIPDFDITTTLPLLSSSLPRSPEITNPVTTRIAASDYPASAVQAREQGATTFSLEIDAAGKVGGCTVTTSSGFPDLDRQSCIVSQKWLFEPAKNLNGDPVAGKTGHIINWRLPNESAIPVPNVAPLKTNPFQDEGAVTIVIDFDIGGKLVDCAVDLVGQLSAFGSPAEFKDRFCRSAIARGAIQPFTDANGKPESRRVVLKMSVDHDKLPQKAATK